MLPGRKSRALRICTNTYGCMVQRAVAKRAEKISAWAEALRAKRAVASPAQAEVPRQFVFASSAARSKLSMANDVPPARRDAFLAMLNHAKRLRGTLISQGEKRRSWCAGSLCMHTPHGILQLTSCMNTQAEATTHIMFERSNEGADPHQV